mmetsp:Transcript_66330/g.205726  ORF Transcript_66330/g.205726 Transcript_66330/m.205726 type:complete len:202 (-) Transcript_66330:1761-2366(-)
MPHCSVAGVSLAAEDEPSNGPLLLHQLAELRGHLPEGLLVREGRPGEEVHAMLELQHDQDRRLPLQRREQRDDGLDGRLEDLAAAVRGGPAAQEVLQDRQAARELGRQHLLQGLAVVNGQPARGARQVPEDGHGAPEQLHGHARALTGPRAHGAEDRHHLEVRGAVRHDVLRELDLAQAGGALDHHDAALGEGAARRRLRP